MPSSAPSITLGEYTHCAPAERGSKHIIGEREVLYPAYRVRVMGSGDLNIAIPLGHPKCYSCFWSRQSTKLDASGTVWLLSQTSCKDGRHHNIISALKTYSNHKVFEILYTIIFIHVGIKLHIASMALLIIIYKITTH